MAMSLSALARIVPFTVVKDTHVATLGFLSMPRPGMLTFIESAKFTRPRREAARPQAVVTTAALADGLTEVAGVGIAESPRKLFFELHNRLALDTTFYGESTPTVVDITARVHPTASIAERDVTIGPGCVIGPHAVIRGRCRLGERVIVHPGVVLGAEGFQTSTFPDGVLDMVHAGGLCIGNDVVIHANAVVACALFDDETTIGDGSRVGNLAFVSHNVQVGRACFIGHGAVVNGNVSIGNGAWIGPGSTVADRLSIGEGARVSLGSAVIEPVAAGRRVTGNVAVEHRRYLRHVARIEGGER